jgi:hypothetical protein
MQSPEQMKTTRAAFDRVFGPANEPAQILEVGSEIPDRFGAGFNRTNTNDLMAATFPPLKAIVQDMSTAGSLCLLAGRNSARRGLPSIGLSRLLPVASLWASSTASKAMFSTLT